MQMRNLKLAVVAAVAIVAVFALNWGANPARAAVGGTSAAVHSSSAPSASSMVLARKIGNVTALTSARDSAGRVSEGC
jgi:hypothetical protein